MRFYLSDYVLSSFSGVRREFNPSYERANFVKNLTTGDSFQKVVIVRNNGVVGLTGFLSKEMCGLLCGPQKRGRN